MTKYLSIEQKNFLKNNASLKSINGIAYGIRFQLNQVQNLFTCEFTEQELTELDNAINIYNKAFIKDNNLATFSKNTLIYNSYYLFEHICKKALFRKMNDYNNVIVVGNNFIIYGPKDIHYTITKITDKQIQLSNKDSNMVFSKHEFVDALMLGTIFKE